MRVGVIPDVHGRDYWKEFILRDDIDLFIFLGDYVDSFDIHNEDIINNLLDIIQFKKDFPDKVILLWGNHDQMYLNIHDGSYMCSGYRPEIGYDLYDIFWPNQKLFKYCHQIGNTIFSHAGIQHNWFINRFKGNLSQENETIEEQINNPKNMSQIEAIRQVGYMRGGMRSDVGGILWCDKEELKKPLEGFMQIVGHSHVKDVSRQERDGQVVYFTDCHRDIKNYLVLQL